MGRALKILLVHNHYRSSAPSGEDVVFDSERRLLESNGVEVAAYERFNDAIDESTLSARVRLALDTAWSGRTYRELSAVLRRLKPDVVHLHNTFPLVSPSAYGACRHNNIPVIQTLHNYRLICPGALLLRDGRPCEDCVGGSLIPALRHGCYRGSRVATSVLVWMLWRNRLAGSYERRVDRYIALTRFAAGRLIAGGLPAARVVVKPNFLSQPPAVGDGRGGYAVYVGRLTQEKGAETLVAAWKQVSGLPLKVVGEGAMRAELERIVRAAGLPVEFCGYRPRAEVFELIRNAALQIVPSECYEGFPLSVIEAYACGTPVVASRLGSLGEVVPDGTAGVLFAPGDPHDLAAKVNALIAAPDRLREMRRRARALFEQRYTAEHNFKQLMAIYRDALSARVSTVLEPQAP